MSKAKTTPIVVVVNSTDDQKDLGDWIFRDEDGDITDKYHFILGADCDRAQVEKAKAEGKKGPYPPVVEIPRSVWEHMLKESTVIKHWMDNREIYTQEKRA